MDPYSDEFKREMAKAELKRRSLLGAGETALSFGSSMIAEPISGLAGLFTAAVGGGLDKSASAVNKTRDFLTYTPRTVEGLSNLRGAAEIMQPVGEAFEYVSRGIGDKAYDITGSEELAAAGYSLPALAAEILGARGVSVPARSGTRFEFSGIERKPMAGRQMGSVTGIKGDNKKQLTWADTLEKKKESAREGLKRLQKDNNYFSRYTGDEDFDSNDTPNAFRAGAAIHELERLGWEVVDGSTPGAGGADSSHYIKARKMVEYDPEYGPEYVSAIIRVANHENTSKLGIHDAPDINIAGSDAVVSDIEDLLFRKLEDEGYTDIQ